MQFKDVVGHPALKQKLAHAAMEGRVSHAQLFVGKEGTGALPMALAYAQYLMCLSPKDGDSCGLCNACHKMATLVHPDLHFSLPVNKEKSTPPPVSDMFVKEWRIACAHNPYITLDDWYDTIKIGNKQGIINVAEAESIFAKLQYKAYEGKYKILIMWFAERMNADAANKLLKLIEEPAPYTVMLFVAQDTGSMLKTILSRTQKVYIPPIAEEDLVKHLMIDSHLPQENVLRAAHLADGNYIKALKLVQENEQSSEFFELFAQLMRKAYGTKPQAVVDLLLFGEELASMGREHQKNFLGYCMRMIRENYACNLGIRQVAYLDRQEDEFSQKFARFINSRNISQLHDVFNDAYRHIAANGNPKMVFADFVLKLMKLIDPKMV